MIINHNITALNTHRQMSNASNAQANSMEKLSSGLRINSAKDDAAGLSISEKMRGQIRGLEQAGRNAQDGISLMQTAEGALNETHDILQRMRELSVQASNDTNTGDDRAEMQKEIDQLKSEITRISTDTEFNTKKLLGGGIGAEASIGAGNLALVNDISVIDPSKLETGQYSVEFTVANKEVTGVTDGGTGMLPAVNITTDASQHTLGNFQLSVTDDTENTGRKVLTLTNSDTGEKLATLNNQDDATGTTYELAGITFTGGAAALQNGNLEFTVEADITATLEDANGVTKGTTVTTDYSKGSIEVGGLEVSYSADLTTGESVDVNVVNNAVQFHIGANEGQKIELAINDMSAKALDIDDVDVTSTAGAEAAITSINNAIQSVSSERSKLGATQNRLDHTINNLNTSSENLTAAESRIRDVDMAKEMMNQTKNSILAQASQAMLAQANQAPQAVLQLLR